MAQKRMFTMKIVDSDAFLDMPLSTQCLYFHLNMRADDDGFVGNAKKIMRMIGASEDDLKVLLAKRFLIMFNDNVIVIKHWWMHNTLAKDRYSETAYTDEKALLYVKENKAYTLNKTEYLAVEKHKKGKREYTEARIKRINAIKDSDLPTYFNRSIANTFNNEKCPVCNCIMDVNDTQTRPTVQHNVPISLGGKHELTNISVICQSCNCSLNTKITPAYNTDEVIKKWECIQNNKECIGNVNSDLDIDIDKDLNLDKGLNLDKDLNSCSKQTSCLEPKDSTISLILNDSSEWTPSQSEIDEFTKLYPNVDVIAELRKMRGWCIGNPKRRKTRYGIKRFVTSWLGKEQDKPSVLKTAKKEKTDWSGQYTDEEYMQGMSDLETVGF